MHAVSRWGISIRLAYEALGISQACYRYVGRRSAENDEIANWLLRLTDNQRNWGFGPCFLYLRNVKGFCWNHMRQFMCSCHLWGKIMNAYVGLDVARRTTAVLASRAVVSPGLRLLMASGSRKRTRTADRVASADFVELHMPVRHLTGIVNILQIVQERRDVRFVRVHARYRQRLEQRAILACLVVTAPKTFQRVAVMLVADENADGASASVMTTKAATAAVVFGNSPLCQQV